VKTIINILFLILITSNTVVSQDLFEENKGQYPDNVKYKLEFNSGQIYFENDRFTYNVYNKGDLSGSQAHHAHSHSIENIKAHAYQMQFINCNPMPSIYSNGQTSDYKNYFIGDRKNWASYVYSYKEIEYQELYEGIDLIIKKVDGGIKYDFIIDEGENPDLIKMKFIGQDNIYLDNGKLLIETSVHPIYELAPYAYQEIDGEKKEVKIEYILENNILSFNIGRYKHDYPLIIDPVLIFSTYSGSTSDNWGFTATYDSKGNVYSGGIVCNAGYPTSLGAFQYDFQGGEAVGSNILGWDVALIKYNETGTQRLWATHIGGTTGEEIPHSLVVNEFDEILVYGTTGSSDFPVSPNAYQSTFAGGTSVTYDNVVKFSNGIDIYVTKLSEDGSQLLASTYVGGTGNDGLNYKAYINFNSVVLMNGNDSLYYNYADGARGEIIVDDKNDIYVGSSTFSTDFPIVAGLQSSSNGQQEGIVFKLTPDLSGMMWSTYLGGTKDDAIYSVDVDDIYDVYVAGGTVSNDFPTTSGAYNTNFNGGTTDGFVSHISFNGQTLVNSSYFGSDQYDQAYFVRLDHDNNVYLTGQTKATGSTLIYNAAYNTPNSGQFIVKFDPTLSSLGFSTVFGTGIGEPNISITAFAVDVCNRIYLSGWGRIWPSDNPSSVYPVYWTDNNFGTHGMDITANAYQSVTDGQDFYIMVMSEDASSLDYGTFFGEQHTGNYYCGHDHVDGGTARFDKKGNIYQSVCASCGFYNSPATPLESCNDFPTTTGAWSEENGGIINETWVCNNAVFRFSFMDDFTAADFQFPGNGCEPYDVEFVNTSLGSSYFWDFGDGNTSTDENPTHTFSAGTYTIMLVANDPGTCNLSDTIYKTITVGVTNSEIAQVEHICVGESIPIGISPLPDPNITYSWDNANTLSDSTISNPIASPSSTTEYHMTASYDACLSLTQTVVVHDNNLNVVAYPDTGICPGEQVTLYANADDSTITYSWYQAGSGSPISSDDTVQVNPTSTTNYIITVHEQFCNVNASDTVEVEIIPLQVVLQDTIICKGDTVNIHAYSLIPGDTIDWNWTPTSQIIANADTANPLVAPLTDTEFYLNASNQRNCTLTDTLFVQVDDLQINITEHQDVVCYGDCNGSLTVTPNGLAPYTYDWTSSDMDSTTSFLCPGVYEVTVTDSIGCTKVISDSITEPTQLLAAITDIQNTLCGDSSYIGSATVTASQGSPTYTYLWSDGQTENTADSLGYGDYFVTITDSHGCDTILSAFIDDPSDLIISTTSLPASCYGYCDGSAFSNIDTPSTTPYTYIWTTGSSDTSIYNLCSGVYTLTVTDADECQRISNVYVAQPDSLNLVINSQGIICHGDSASVFADVLSGGTPDYSYLWNTGDTSQTITGIYEGTYTVIATDAHNCKDTTEITLVDPPIINYDTATVVATCDIACNGIGTVFLDGGIPPYTYLWDNGETDSTVNNLCVGNHDVTVTDANGCSHIVDVNIGYNPDGFGVNAWADEYIIYNDESTNLHTVDGNTYVWTPQESLDDGNIQNPEASPEYTTIYEVLVTDENGCYNRDTVKIIVMDVICGEPYIYVPNAFTPNGDGNNDILYAYGDVIDELYFAVYDRWGELMFETTDITKGWNGTYNGKLLDPAVFVYYIKAICRDKETFIKKGNVTLIR